MSPDIIPVQPDDVQASRSTDGGKSPIVLAPPEVKDFPASIVVVASLVEAVKGDEAIRTLVLPRTWSF